MGVRQSVEQSMPDETRLHDIVVREKNPEKELPFDPERDIDDGVWGAVQMKLDMYREKDSWGAFARQATEMKIVFPERTFDPNLSDQDFKGMQKVLAQYSKIGNWTNRAGFSSIIVGIKFLFPEKIQALNLDETTWRDMKKELNKLRKNDDRAQFFTQAKNMKIISPERTEDLNLDEATWSNMKQSLDHYRQNGDWVSFSEWAGIAKILFPEKAQEFDLDEPTWQSMKEWLDNFSKWGNWSDVSLQAMNMKILAAKEIKFTSDGLVCVMPSRESFKEEKPELPVRKSF